MTSSSDDERRSRWRAQASAELGGKEPDSLTRRSAAGVHIHPLYTAADLPAEEGLVRDLTAPFGGVGISGIGREGGDYALDFYSDLKTLQILEDSTR